MSPAGARLFFSLVLVATVGLPIAGCRARGEKRAREYMPDMVRGPAYKAFAPNAVTRNGLTLQKPVFGTIARGQQPFHYGPGEAEAVRAGQQLRNPFHATPRVLAEGKALYAIYCQVCHGETGNGDGPIAGKIPPPASYKSVRVLSFTPGRMFHVVTMGSGKMPSYASQLSSDDRWRVITYVNTALQGPGGQYAAQPNGNRGEN